MDFDSSRDQKLAEQQRQHESLPLPFKQQQQQHQIFRHDTPNPQSQSQSQHSFPSQQSQSRPQQHSFPSQQAQNNSPFPSFEYGFFANDSPVANFSSASHGNSLLNGEEYKAFGSFLNSFYTLPDEQQYSQSNAFPSSMPVNLGLNSLGPFNPRNIPEHGNPLPAANSVQAPHRIDGFTSMKLVNHIGNLSESKGLENHPEHVNKLEPQVVVIVKEEAETSKKRNRPRKAPAAKPFLINTKIPRKVAKAVSTPLTIQISHATPFNTAELESGKTPLSSTSSASGKKILSKKAHAREKELLTEEQKKSNHVQSEQRRRALIKEGFGKLEQITPELSSPPSSTGPGNTGGGHSKSAVLFAAAAYIEELQDIVQRLRLQKNNLNGPELPGSDQNLNLIHSGTSNDTNRCCMTCAIHCINGNN